MPSHITRGRGEQNPSKDSSTSSALTYSPGPVPLICSLSCCFLNIWVPLSSFPLLLLFPLPKTLFFQVSVASPSDLLKAFCGYPIKNRYFFPKFPIYLLWHIFLPSTYQYLTHSTFYLYFILFIAFLFSLGYEAQQGREFCLWFPAVSPVSNGIYYGRLSCDLGECWRAFTTWESPTFVT